MLFAQEYLGEVGVGATSPLFFRADDNNIYIVKMMQNPLGGKVLASELIAVFFGQILDLSFPFGDIFCITEDWLAQYPEYRDSMITAGYHFASRYLPNTCYATSDHLASVCNLSSIAGMILFDHLLHNADRAHNRKNMLFYTDEEGRSYLYGIDHSHLFHSGRWSIDSLSTWSYRIRTYSQNLYGILLEKYLHAHDFYPYIARLSDIRDDTFRAVIAHIPSIWLPDKKEREALYRFFKIRQDLVERIYQHICRSIPEVHGGFLRL